MSLKPTEMTTDEMVQALKLAFQGDFRRLPKDTHLLSVPADWRPEDIANLQAFFDSLVDVGIVQHKVTLLPHGLQDVRQAKFIEVLEDLLDQVERLASDTPDRATTRKGIACVRQKLRAMG